MKPDDLNREEDTANPDAMAGFSARTGWSIRAEARIAAEALKIESERHAQALRDIEERFQLDAWRHVEKNWKPEELEAV